MLNVAPRGIITFDQVKAAARGRWRSDILPCLGISVPATPRRHGPCPGCGGEDRFRFDDEDGDGTFICSGGTGQVRAGDGFDLVAHALHLSNPRNVLERVARALALDPDRPMLAPVETPAPPPAAMREVARYAYADQDGDVRYEVVRLEDGAGNKTFRIARPGGAWGLGDEAPLPYRLPDLLAADPDALVWITEGEKDADRLAGLGLVAICNHGGAGNWRPELTPHLAGRTCILLQDNDRAGEKHVQVIGEALRTTAAATAVLRLPVPEKGDVSDWLDAGHTLEELTAAARRALAGDVDPPLSILWVDDASPTLDAADFVQGVLTRRGMSVVYGDSNVGKTFFAMDLALHVATGREWRGHEVEQGAVIYLALEGTAGVVNRAIAWRKRYAEEMGRRSIPMAIVTTPLDLLSSDTDAQKVVDTITIVARQLRLPVLLTVVDTLSRAMAGGNENASEDMGALVRHGDLIRAATGSHLMWIHHSGKDAARGARGHSLLRAATDTEIEVTRSGDGPSVARATKQRELDCSGEWPFGLTVVELGWDARGNQVTSCVADPVEAQGLASEVKEKRRRDVGLGGGAEVVWAVINNMMIENGEGVDAPPHLQKRVPGIPPSIKRVLPVRQLIERASPGLVEGRKTPPAQAVRDALKSLQGTHKKIGWLKVDATQEYIWRREDER